MADEQNKNNQGENKNPKEEKNEQNVGNNNNGSVDNNNSSGNNGGIDTVNPGNSQSSSEPNVALIELIKDLTQKIITMTMEFANFKNEFVSIKDQLKKPLPNLNIVPIKKDEATDNNNSPKYF